MANLIETTEEQATIIEYSPEGVTYYKEAE